MQANKEIVQADYGLPIRFFYSNDGHPSNVLPHFHDDIEILFLLTGKLHMYIDGKHHTFVPNDLIVLNSNSVHSITAHGSDVTAYVLQISYAFLSNCINEAENKGIYFNVPFCSKSTLSGAEDEHINELKTYMTDLYHCFWPPTKYSSLKIMGIVYMLLYCLTTHFRVQSPLSDSHKIKNLKQLSVVTEYILTHFAEPCSLPELAALVSYSPSYLSRSFRQTMGLTLSDYINQVRLEHAYIDIVSTDAPIMYICEKNGFSNYQFFNVKFKEKYNYTPSKVRQLTRDNIVIK